MTMQSVAYPVYPTFAPHDLNLWTVTSKINRVHSLIMVNMSAKFDEESQNILVSHMDTLMDGITTALLYPLCDNN